MTIKECIDIVDNLKPNQYSIEDKVEWLSFLDQTIVNDVLKTHEGYHGEYEEFYGYSPDRLSVHLIVAPPYDRLYTAYLKMKIDEENGETARYNNSATMYNSYMMEYKRWYNKHHMPISVHERRPAQTQNNPQGGGSTGTGTSKPIARIREVKLTSSGWIGEGNLYSQVVSIDGVTENSQVDLTPSVEQLVAFYEKDLSFVTENEDGVVTVYAIGQKPTNDYTIQVTITEVIVNG